MYNIKPKCLSLSVTYSVAKSLGSLTVSETLFNLATSSERRFDVISRVVTDREAVTACLNFADDHR